VSGETSGGSSQARVRTSLSMHALNVLQNKSSSLYAPRAIERG
jgi:hypothetical protein